MASRHRGYIRRRGRWTANAPWYVHGQAVPRRRRKASRKTSRKSYRKAAPRKSWRRRVRRNPLYRTAKGRFTRRSAGRKLRRISGGGWKNTPRRRVRRTRRNVWYGQPRRHRKAALKGRRRHARRNPYRLASNPMEAVMGTIKEAFSMDTLTRVFHGAIGFGGTVAGTKLITDVLGVDFLKTGTGKIVATGGVAILGGAVAGMVTKDKELAKRVMAGGLLATALRVLGVILPDTAKQYIPTLGEDDSAQFRAAIEQEVLKELRAAGTEGMIYLPPAGSEYYLPSAGSAAYMTELEASRAAALGAYMTRKDAQGAGVGFYPHETDEMGSKGLVERF